MNFTDEGKLGIGLALIALLITGLTAVLSPPWRDMAGWTAVEVVIIVIVGFVILYCYKIRARWIILIGVAVVMLSNLTIWLTREPDNMRYTHCDQYTTSNPHEKQRISDFENAVNEFQLKSSGCPILFERASIMSLEYASVLWLFGPDSEMIVLYNDGRARTVFETNFCVEKWCGAAGVDSKEALSRFEKFGVKPPDLHTPYGQMAIYLDQHPEDFKNVGWMKWSCEFGFRQIFGQKLQTGTAYGVYPTVLNDKDGSGRVFFVNSESQKFVPRTIDDANARCS